MNISHTFQVPLLIYDDKCSSCTKFARLAKTLSRGRIRVIGHYSREAMEAKKLIFPSDYDPTNMFWFVARDRAYGARLGLAQVAKEIIIGLLKREVSTNDENDSNDIVIDNQSLGCQYRPQMSSCRSARNTLGRIVDLIRNTGEFRFQP